MKIPSTGTAASATAAGRPMSHWVRKMIAPPTRNAGSRAATRQSSWPAKKNQPLPHHIDTAAGRPAGLRPRRKDQRGGVRHEQLDGAQGGQHRGEGDTSGEAETAE